MINSFESFKAFYLEDRPSYQNLSKDEKQAFDNRMRDICRPSEFTLSHYRRMATTELWGNDY